MTRQVSALREMTADLQTATQSASLVLGAKCGLVVRQIVIHREPGRRLGHLLDFAWMTGLANNRSILEVSG